MGEIILVPRALLTLRCDEGLWPNPYSELASDWLVLTPDIVFLPCFCGIRLFVMFVIFMIRREFQAVRGFV